MEFAEALEAAGSGIVGTIDQTLEQQVVGGVVEPFDSVSAIRSISI